MESRIVYMDNNATTRMADEVKQILKETEDLYGNGSSMHSLGRNAREAIEWARGEVAVLLGAKPDEIFFNSGATEGNNTVFNTFRDLIDDRRYHAAGTAPVRVKVQQYRTRVFLYLFKILFIYTQYRHIPTSFLSCFYLQVYSKPSGTFFL